MTPTGVSRFDSERELRPRSLKTTPKMEYEESKRSGYQEREDKDFADGVHIREDHDGGVTTYAVFDGEEQVSGEGGPLNEEYFMDFIEGYSKAKKEYNE